MTLAVTFWRSLTEPSGTFAEVTWDELAAKLSKPAPKPSDPEKPKLGGWSPATFAEARRAKDRVQLVTALVLDIDDGATPLERVHVALCGARRIVHSTRRATPAAPRWRVVRAVSRPMTPEEHAHVWHVERTRLASLNVILDEQTKDPSRFWFLPCEPAEGSYVCDVRDGEPLDVDAYLSYAPSLPAIAHAVNDSAEVSPISAPVAIAHSEPDALARISPATRRKRAAAYLEHAEPAVSGEQGHKTAMRVVTAVVRGFALTPADALEVLATWNARCAPPWSHAELAHKVTEAERVGALAWGAKLLEPERAKEAAPERAATTDTEQLAPELPFDDIWTPEPELSLVVPALGICPGPAHLVAGSWYTGKTLFLMALGLAVASGRDLFGLYGVKRGKWRHFDHEMGRRGVKRYLQRMVAGLGVSPSELRGHLGLHVMPTLNLTTPKALDHYVRLLEGVDICTIDPLRAAAPGQDENDSSFRQWIDMLNVASDRTGCAIMVLHHGGKPVEGSSRRNTGRGTSAIDDAVQTKFVLTAEEKGAPIQVSHEKTRELTQPLDDFWIRIESDADAVRLVHMGPEQMADLAGVKSAQQLSVQGKRAREAIAAMFMRYHGEAKGTRADVLKLVVGVNRNVVSNTFTEMCVEGSIQREKGVFRYGGIERY